MSERRTRRHSRRSRSPLWIGALAAALAVVLALGVFLIGGSPPRPPAASMDHGWELVLVNRDHSLPEGWDPELVTLTNGTQVDERIYPALQEMFDDMRAQDVYPVVRDGWRSEAVQRELMDERVAQYRGQGYSWSESRELAEQWVALPGTSEHQLGLAVDINPDSSLSTGDQVYGWLAEHACEYGFVRRYPPDKTEITGISNEPWHYRYVGMEAAEEMEELGLCLEEYVEYLDGDRAA